MEILRKIILWVPNGSWTHDLPVSGWICVSHTRTKPVTRKSWVRLLLGTQKFLSISTWERFSVIYTLSKSPVHLSSPVVFVSVSVCNCASLMCDKNPTRDYLPSLNLPVPMYTTWLCYFRGPITIIIQSDCSTAIYKCFPLFMFWVVSDYANPKLQDFYSTGCVRARYKWKQLTSGYRPRLKNAHA